MLTSTHATELVLDRLAFSAMLDNSSDHVADLRCLKHFKIEFESVLYVDVLLRTTSPPVRICMYFVRVHVH